MHSVESGTKLADYEISMRLGKGGMDEVYQAEDEELGRDEGESAESEFRGGSSSSIAEPLVMRGERRG